MNKYEAMFIVKPDLSEEDRKTAFASINETITKQGGAVTQAAMWSEKRKLGFPIKKHHDGVYYLVSFNSAPSAIAKLKELYKLNDTILRVLISRL